MSFSPQFHLDEWGVGELIVTQKRRRLLAPRIRNIASSLKRVEQALFYSCWTVDLSSFLSISCRDRHSTVRRPLTLNGEPNLPVIDFCVATNRYPLLEDDFSVKGGVTVNEILFPHGGQSLLRRRSSFKSKLQIWYVRSEVQIHAKSAFRALYRTKLKLFRPGYMWEQTIYFTNSWANNKRNSKNSSKHGG